MALVYRTSKLGRIIYRFAYNTANIGTGVAVGVIPQNAEIYLAQTQVATAFNAGGNDFLRIGISAGGIEIANDESLAAAGVLHHFAHQNLNPLAADRTIYVRYAQSGAAATAGAAQVVILWTFG